MIVLVVQLHQIDVTANGMTTEKGTIHDRVPNHEWSWNEVQTCDRSTTTTAWVSLRS